MVRWALAVLLVGCGEPPADFGSRISLDPENPGLVPGQTVQAAVRPHPRVPQTARATWWSDDEAIATVDENGLITAVAPGVVRISASVVELEGSLRVHVVPVSDALDSLLVSLGPLTGSFACNGEQWRAFPRDSEVTVKMSVTVSRMHRAAIEGAIAQVDEATAGALSVRIEDSDELSPIPTEGEVSVAEGIPPAELACLPRGCTIWDFASTGALRSSRIVLPADQSGAAFAHDVVGHGILGLCHILPGPIGGAHNSLMSYDPNTDSGEIPARLSPLDIAVVRAAFESGLPAGALRSDFQELGLVNR
jgi:hypothetical protein